MFERCASMQECFLWGAAAATVGWICLSVLSALVLGLMIRRSNDMAERQSSDSEATPVELLDIEAPAYDAAKAD
jgi:hypothetical protein